MQFQVYITKIDLKENFYKIYIFLFWGNKRFNSNNFFGLIIYPNYLIYKLKINEHFERLCCVLTVNVVKMNYLITQRNKINIKIM